MLAVNGPIQIFLLCLVIVRNEVICLESSDQSPQISIPEVAEVPLALNASEVPSFSGSSRKLRILEKTTVRHESKHNSVNTTILKKVTEDNVEDDPTTTTRLPGPVSIEPTSSSMKTMEFRPSVHVGEIHDYETRKSSTNPFNNVQHMKFENSVSIDDHHDTGRVRAPFFPSSSSSIHSGDRATPVAGRKKNRVNFVDTDSRYDVNLPVEYYVPQQVYHQQQEQTEEAVVGDDDNIDVDNHNQLMPLPMGHDGVVSLEFPMSHYPVSEVTGRPMTLGQPAYPAITTDQQMHLHQYKPGINNVRTVYVKPTKFHGEVMTPIPFHIQHYEYVSPVSSESMAKLNDLRHHKGNYQIAPQSADLSVVGKPDTVVILSSHRETAFTSSTRKFPYKFYHPDAVHQDAEYYYVPEEPHAYPPRMRVSPWKKIIHLIGAFLPLGLLLATLKPNFVRVNAQNMTQPDIIFPKLRDLPAEHKRGRIENGLDNVQQDACEDKSICQLILSGSEPNANLLQNILWNLTNKSTDQEAKEHGLHEIFAAVRQKDCSTIEC